RGGGNGPALQRRGIGHIDEHVDDRRSHHPADGGHDRQYGPARIAQIAGNELALEFDTHHEEENPQQHVGRPSHDRQMPLKRRRADGEVTDGCIHIGGIGQEKSRDRRDNQKDTADGFFTQQLGKSAPRGCVASEESRHEHEPTGSGIPVRPGDRDGDMCTPAGLAAGRRGCPLDHWLPHGTSRNRSTAPIADSAAGAPATPERRRSWQSPKAPITWNPMSWPPPTVFWSSVTRTRSAAAPMWPNAKSLPTAAAPRAWTESNTRAGSPKISRSRSCAPCAHESVCRVCVRITPTSTVSSRYSRSRNYLTWSARPIINARSRSASMWKPNIRVISTNWGSASTIC